MVRDTPPYGHSLTYQISLTYLERQKYYGPDKKILFKKQLFDLEAKGQGPIKVITVRDTPPCGHAPTYQISLTHLERQKSYGPDKLRWEAEEKIRLKQYVSLRSKGKHNYKPCTWTRGSHIEYQIKIIKLCTLTRGGHIEYQIKIIKPCTLIKGGHIKYQIKL